jgi:hypothetical protein
MRKKVLILLLILMSLPALLFAQRATPGGDNKYGSQPQPTPTYRLRITSNVNTATVFINGNYQQGATPPASFNLQRGTYTVTLRAPGFEDGVVTVNLNENENIHINLQRRRATLIPQTQHPDFILIVDGTRRRIQPLEIKPGVHTIEFRIGSLSVSGTYTFEAGQTYRIQPSLGIDFSY